MQLNFASREVTLKVVYYGPALSGKTTNLKALHDLTSDESRGRLMTLETRDDRTLFFDMLPLVFQGVTSSGADSGVSVRIKVFTVPGQVLHGSTRRLVLQGADGVIFVADSRIAETETNAASFLDLKSNLDELGIQLRELPLVIQFNKRDLPEVRTDAEIQLLAKRGREPVFKASALTGDGVLESFFGILNVTLSKLEQEHKLSRIIGLEQGAFPELAAKKLGCIRSPDELLQTCLGGSLVYVAPAPRPGNPDKPPPPSHSGGGT